MLGPRDSAFAEPEDDVISWWLRSRRLGQVAQDVVEHAAVPEILKLGGRIDAADDREARHAAVGRAVELDGQSPARRQVRQPADRDDFLTGQTELVPAVDLELQRQDAHAHEVRAVDTL